MAERSNATVCKTVALTGYPGSNPGPDTKFPLAKKNNLFIYYVHMEEGEAQPKSSTQYYIVGFIVLVAVIVAGYLLRNKATIPEMTTPVTEAITATPTPGPITKLACDTQYYNPVVGFPRYYLSVEGGDLPTAKTVTCQFTVSVDDKVVATETATSPLTDKPQRGGGTFRCTTSALDLAPNTPTVVDVVLVDDQQTSATCGATFLLPTP